MIRLLRVYVGEWAGSRSLGRPRKRCTDTVKDCLKKRSLDIRQARIMWRGFVGGGGECMGRCQGSEPLTLTRCHSCELPQLFDALEGWKSVCGQAHNLRA